MIVSTVYALPDLTTRKYYSRTLCFASAAVLQVTATAKCGYVSFNIHWEVSRRTALRWRLQHLLPRLTRCFCSNSTVQTGCSCAAVVLREADVALFASVRRSQRPKHHARVGSKLEAGDGRGASAGTRSNRREERRRTYILHNASKTK
jgi:hypothetical protein